MSESKPFDATSYIRRSSGPALIIAAAVSFLLWKLIALWLAVFGSAVLAVVLTGTSRWVSRHTGLRYSLSLLSIVVLVSVGILGSSWLFGTQIYGQLNSLKTMLPQAYNELLEWMAISPTGQVVGAALDSVTPDEAAVREQLGGILASTTSVIGLVSLMVVGAIYFALHPDPYVRGTVRLVPDRHRKVFQETLRLCAVALQSWVGGQLFSMAAVGLLTALGLWLLKVPAVLGLALLTASLGIVPIVGPILAAVPAALLGFTVSPETAIGVVALYVIVQQVEGNVLQPVIQKYAVDLPPALLLFSLVAIGALCGAMGVLLAAPLTVVGYVIIKRVYVGHVLGDAGCVVEDGPERDSEGSAVR